MERIGSVSPLSSHPVVRRESEAATPFFNFLAQPNGQQSPATDAPASSEQKSPGSDLSSLGRACSVAEGPATSEAIDQVAAILAEAPEVGLAARIERDGHGAPIQSMPALACAAMQGADPEGWVGPLLAMGATFDAAMARSEARLALLATARGRGLDLSMLNIRCDALSIWTVACAEARNPHSALRAIARARQLSPRGLAPLSSELAKFPTPAELDKPTLSARARAGAFVEAGRSSPAFFSGRFPSWLRGPRGGELGELAEPVAQALSREDAQALLMALRAGPSAHGPSVDAFIQALSTSLASGGRLGAPPGAS